MIIDIGEQDSWDLLCVRCLFLYRKHQDGSVKGQMVLKDDEEETDTKLKLQRNVKHHPKIKRL